jgi:hypothetical protein
VIFMTPQEKLKKYDEWISVLEKLEELMKK